MAELLYSTIMHKYQAVLFTRWTGFTRNRSILMPRLWYADLKVCVNLPNNSTVESTELNYSSNIQSLRSFRSF